LATELPHLNGGDFPVQLAIPIKENVKAMITQSKKMSRTDPVKEEEKAESELEIELRPEKEEENLGKASPKDISDTHLLPFPHQAKQPMEDEKISHFVEVIQRMYTF
jgi:hypothetical protein